MAGVTARSPARALSAPAGSPIHPLLPLAHPPQSPSAAPLGGVPLHQQTVRRHLHRVLLLGLVAFALMNALWASRGLYNTWQGHGSEWQQVEAAEQRATAAAAAHRGSVRAQASSAADNAVTAAMDAAGALTSAAGAVKHTAKAAGQAAGAAMGAAKAAGQAAGAAAGAALPAATKAAVAVGSAAKGAVGLATGGSGSNGTAKGQEERKAREPAELLPPSAAAASNDTCAQVSLRVRHCCACKNSWKHLHASPVSCSDTANITPAVLCRLWASRKWRCSS